MPRRRLLERAMIHHTRDAGPECRLLWIMMHIDADDYGRLFAHAKHLSGDLFQFDAEITPEDVEAMLDTLAERGLILRYTVDGLQYAQILCWNQPGPIGTSRIPPPPGAPALPEPKKRGRPPRTEAELAEIAKAAEIAEATKVALAALAAGAEPRPDDEAVAAQFLVDLAAAVASKEDAVVSSVEMVHVPPAPVAKAKRQRKRDEVLDALAEIEGVVGLATVTAQAWSRLAKAKASIVEVEPELTADEIRLRSRRLAAKWPNASVTANSLASHWGQLSEDGTPLFDDRMFDDDPPETAFIDVDEVSDEDDDESF